MIFATTGSQMPFDRLIQALDEWAATQANDTDIFAQIGSSSLRPKHLRAVAAMSPTEFRHTVEGASLVVSHAGMGSVITALEFGKPLVIMPRLGQLRETRNDHQVATAKWLASKPGIFVAMTEAELGAAISKAASHKERLSEVAGSASNELLTALKEFIGK